MGAINWIFTGIYGLERAVKMMRIINQIGSGDMVAMDVLHACTYVCMVVNLAMERACDAVVAKGQEQE